MLTVSKPTKKQSLRKSNLLNYKDIETLEYIQGCFPFEK